VGKALYVEQEVVPFAEAGKEIMLIFQDHGPASARPIVCVTALRPNSQITVLSGKGGNTDAFTATSLLALADRGQKGRIELPIGGDMTDQVSVVRVDDGQVAVSVVSPSRVKAEFRTRKHP
jgi:hypothetical protein